MLELQYESASVSEIIITTSWNGNSFRDTGLLWGESTGHHWIPLIKASDSEIWCFLWSAPEQKAEKTNGTPVIWDAIVLIMTLLYCECGYYLNQCWLTLNRVHWLSCERNSKGIHGTLVIKFTWKCIYSFYITAISEANEFITSSVTQATVWPARSLMMAWRPYSVSVHLQ